MNRVTPGKIILDELGDIESGVRQLIRNGPLEVIEVTLTSGRVLRVPTPDETCEGDSAMTIALKFRDITVSLDDAVETWPFEGILVAVERGTLPDWRRFRRADRHVAASPVDLHVRQGRAIRGLLVRMRRARSRASRLTAVQQGWPGGQHRESSGKP
jgi:hypothetical protein